MSTDLPESHSLLVQKPRVDFVAALLELHRVHRIEQARLLREACLHSIACSDHGRLHLVERRRWERPRAASDIPWHAACREELESAVADGASLHPRLPTLLVDSPDRWPTPVVLARESLDLERGHSGLLVLALAYLSENHPRSAIAALRTLLDEEPCDERRAAATEALARAFEAAGEPKVALSWWEVALAERRSDPGVAVGLLCLALRRADRRRAGLAITRLSKLDLSVPGVRGRFRRAIQASRARDRLLGGLLPDAGVSRGMVSRLAREDSGPAGLIARALL